MSTTSQPTHRPDNAPGTSYPLADHTRSQSPARRSTETKSAFKTTELIAYVVAVAGVLLASYLVQATAQHADYFRADKAWFYIVLLTLGYLGSRGLAKSGSQDNYDAK